MRSTSLMLLFTLFISTATSQNSVGNVFGTVTDTVTGDPLVGATIVIVGTTLGGTTDVEGKYRVQRIPIGTHTLRISYVGFTAKSVSDIAVLDGKDTQLDVALISTTIEVEEVVVTARRIRSAESAILSMRRESASIGDGISGESIKRTPDATSADALKRVVGVSIVDNKYVQVRGVSGRYSQTTLNGTSLTGSDTESDKRSFSFDLIPSNLLDQTMVVKTVTPDRPGEMTGGLVELRTLDFPDKTMFRAGIGTSMHSLSTGRLINASQGGSRDWFGMDDGFRSTPTPAQGGSNTWNGLQNSWKLLSVKAPLNQSLTLVYGDRFTGEDTDLGIISAFSYKGSRDRSETVQDFTTGSGMFKQEGYNDSYSVLWGGIFDAHLKLGPSDKLSFTNAYNRSSDDKVQTRAGIDFQDREIRSTSSQWTERTMYSGQFSGDHVFSGLQNASLAWRWSYGESTADEPDRKRMKYQRQNGDTGPFAITGTENNERAWTAISDISRGGNLELSLPISELTLKLGGGFESGDRAFHIDYYSAEFLGSDHTMTFLPPDSIFLPKNFGPHGWVVRKLSDVKDQYRADRRVSAAYAMVDIPFSLAGLRFRAVGGARFEQARLRAFTYGNAFSNGVASVVEDTASLSNKDVLPSINVTYMLNSAMNVRVAMSKSVNRPELREIARVSFYDFVNYEELRGNPNLRRALVSNFDVRYEFYPNAGEIIALGWFSKRIEDAIEQRVVWSSNPGKEWFNTPRADNFGWEFEVRKDLSLLSKALDGVQMTLNYARIFSSVVFHETKIVGLDSNFVPIRATFTDKRPMQGQASYTLNLGLSVSNIVNGTSVSILYNRFGQRVDAVADIREEDIFEVPRGTLDFSLTQKITQSVEVKITGKDLTASKRSYFLRNGSVYKEVRVGSSYGIQFAYAM